MKETPGERLRVGSRSRQLFVAAGLCMWRRMGLEVPGEHFLHLLLDVGLLTCDGDTADLQEQGGRPDCQESTECMKSLR
ncbi:MAG: hypothetical protein ACREVO_04420 [Steroidobacteraceae bacterium]